MKNVINELLKDVYRKIPNEILREAFYEELKTSRSLDAIVKELIISDIVLANCNLYSGKMKKITISQDYMKNIDDKLFIGSFLGNYGVYAIPPHVRENRPIVAITGITYPTSLAPFGTYPEIGVAGRSVVNGMDEMLESFTHSPAYIAPSAFIIDGDAGIIQLTPPSSIHIDWIMSCFLSFDKEFSNIGLNMINPLKKMVEYAAKSFIYNRMIIKINQGYLTGGFQLESIKNIIESYQDAEERFEEALMKFRGSSMFSPENFRDTLSLMF